MSQTEAGVGRDYEKVRRELLIRASFEIHASVLQVLW